MPTTVACPECGSKLRVPEELAGREVRCARCSTTFTAPEIIPEVPPADVQVPFEMPSSGLPPTPPPEPGDDLAFRLDLSLEDGSPPARPTRPTAVPALKPIPVDSDAQSPRRPALNDDHDDLQDCPECGKQLHRDYRRCPYCGRRLSRSSRDLPAYPIRRDPEAHRGGLVMALGIIAILTFGCPPAGLVFGILAWFMGQGDLKRMKAGEMDSAGEGLTQAGWICGIIATALSGLMLVTCGPLWALSLLHPGRRY
jgi:predicted Zn finger-like uncharacterized protein